MWKEDQPSFPLLPPVYVCILAPSKCTYATHFISLGPIHATSSFLPTWLPQLVYSIGCVGVLCECVRGAIHYFDHTLRTSPCTPLLSCAMALPWTVNSLNISCCCFSDLVVLLLAQELGRNCYLGPPPRNVVRFVREWNASQPVIPLWTPNPDIGVEKQLQERQEFDF